MLNDVKSVRTPEPEVSKSLLPQPCQLVIFGAAGDLSWRKLLPAVYNLNIDGVLPSHFAVVGFGLPAEGAVAGDPDEYIRQRAKDGISRFSRQPLDESHWADFARALFFVPGSFNDARAYAQLKAKMEAVDQQFGIPGSRVYYLAVPPRDGRHVCVEHLKSAGTHQRSARAARLHARHRREADRPRSGQRPRGHSLGRQRASPRARLIASITTSARRRCRTCWCCASPTASSSRCGTRNTSITCKSPSPRKRGWRSTSQQTGEMIATRAGYYEGVGALRDMVQNHMLQVLCVVAMEPPWSLKPDVVRDAKSGVLNCLRPMTPAEVEKNVVRAQYIEGDVAGKRVPGYRKEVRESFEVMKKPLPPESVHSTTETFVALKLFIDNWRWAGVPFYLRTGKRLPKRASEVAIQFKDVPQVLFNDQPDVPLEPTVLSLRVQPEEGLSMRIASKLPGPKVRIYPVKMEFNYSSSFGGTSPEAYERLILDVMAGDATLFMRRDAVEAAWQFVMPILDHWAKMHVRDLPEYQCGTWGPVEADRIIVPDGRQWRTL